MAAGLRVFDQFGNLKVDLSDRLLRYVGMFYIGIGTPTSWSNDGILTGTPYAAMHMVSDGGSSWPDNNLRPPAYYFSGNTIFVDSSNAPHRVMVWVH
ncbi:hypothetical protein LJR090_002563 [Bosea sp. LjRoot90]|uniref:hypothetical protein n=1 Tax=Bosea sp. LjRoot90 TaxID=3342342 RepID=UPI003ED006AB